MNSLQGKHSWQPMTSVHLEVRGIYALCGWFLEGASERVPCMFEITDRIGVEARVILLATGIAWSF